MCFHDLCFALCFGLLKDSYCTRGEPILVLLQMSAGDMTKMEELVVHRIVHSLDVGVKFVDLWLEESFQLSPLGLECGS